jgi:hypothetical protein
LKTPYRDGATHVFFEALDFVSRLAALAPKPRVNLTRFHRLADAIYMEELEKNELHDRISQDFAVFLPVKSIGVVGDNRACECVIALRAVEMVDSITANRQFSHRPANAGPG